MMLLAGPAREVLPAQPTTRWLLRPPAPTAAVAGLSASLAIPATLASVLYARGVRSSEMLEPELRLNSNPALKEAAERLVQATKAKKRIRIHGDYDADGVTATSILVSGLRELGADVHPFVPDRLHEGYGVHPERVEDHIAACDVFVTVDCGVSNLAEIERIVAAGVEAIVTDHHAPGRELPGCLIVHPKLDPNFHEDLPTLTGAGVAFHLLWAVRQALGLPAPLEYADLAAIGTIADVAPLLGENRAIAKAGLVALQNTRWVGLQALMTAQNLRDPSARSVAFVIAPRINAAGRMGDADAALELLTTENTRRAAELAHFLEARNQDRRVVEQRMLEEALAIVDVDAPALVVHKDGWHPGVMGIVASRLLERFYKPVFIAAEGKGSVRSTPGISAVQALDHAATTLKRYGGHTQAAGFAIHMENLPAFRDCVFDFVARHPRPTRTVTCDALLSPQALSQDLHDAILDLEPFGEGNPKPSFWVRAPLESPGVLGKERQHFQCRIAGKKGKQWNSAYDLTHGDVVDAALQLEENTWQGRTSLELYVNALRYSAPLRFAEQELVPGPEYARFSPEDALKKLEANPMPVFAEGVGLAFLQKKFPTLEVAGASSQNVMVFSLPDAALLCHWLASGATLHFALGEKTLAALEANPGVRLEDLREHRKQLFDASPAVQALLEELGHDLGRNAYRTHPRLARLEAETQRTEQFVLHYRIADAASFSTALRVLYGGP